MRDVQLRIRFPYVSRVVCEIDFRLHKQAAARNRNLKCRKTLVRQCVDNQSTMKHHKPTVPRPRDFSEIIQSPVLPSPELSTLILDGAAATAYRWPENDFKYAQRRHRVS
jgi:hypothetical protein